MRAAAARAEEHEAGAPRVIVPPVAKEATGLSHESHRRRRTLGRDELEIRFRLDVRSNLPTLVEQQTVLLIEAVA
jgi:hypothetical protein